MKRNDWILITATALYTFLFYKQAAGINFLIFNIALIIGICLKEQQETLNIRWWMAAAGSLTTAVCITIYGNTFSIVVNLISLSLLAGISFSSRSSVVLALLYSWYSYCSSIVFMVLDYIERRKNQPEHNSSVFTKRLMLVLIPVIVTLIFFFIYKSSSALFNDFAQKINLDFISWSWVRFTLLGFVILYGFFYHRQIRTLANLDEHAKSTIEPGMGKKITLFGKELEIDDENFSGTVLFVLLNVLLLVVNYLDFNYLFIDGKLPEGITYTDFVHQGVGMIIFSVVVAIAIILFYFRGDLNFFKQNKIIKAFAYLWILQNFILVLLAAYRTGTYSEYALTYKRIGIFIYLGLTSIGLITTLIKIAAIKSNNYLFRINGWLFYGVFVVLSFFNWDMIITRSNVKHPTYFDICYLIQLSWTNLPQLVTLDDARNDISMFESGAIKGECYSEYGNKFSEKLYYFMLEKESSDWRAWSYERARVDRELSKPECSDKITYMNLSYIRKVNLEVLKQFSKMQELNLNSTEFTNIVALHHFPGLKSLDVSNNNIKDLKGIEKLELLEKITLSGNPIDDYTPLYELKNLKEIHIDGRMNYGDSLEIKKHLPNVIVTY